MTDRLPIGLHAGVSHDLYHGDPCERPSLSASIAKVLVGRSPAHAWQQHPRYGNLRPPKDESEVTERGSIVHAMLLGGGPVVETVPYRDWKKKHAQELRKAAREAGRLPVLAHKFAEYTEAANTLRDNARLGTLVAEGLVETELVAVWESDGVLCRGRLDAWEGDALTIHDPKTCEDARTASRGDNILRFGRDIQAAAYIEAVETINPLVAGRVRFRWHFLEVVPPFGVIEAEPTRVLLEHGRTRWERAKALWRRCQTDNDWPGYSESVLQIDPPPWAIQQEFTDQLTASDEGVEVAHV